MQLEPLNLVLWAVPEPLAARVNAALAESAASLPHVAAPDRGHAASVDLWLLHQAAGADDGVSRLQRLAPGSAAAVLVEGGAAAAPTTPWLRGLAWLPHTVAAPMLQAAVQAAHRGLRVTPAASATPTDVLTTRELEVFDLMSRGLSNREIGLLLGISAHTAKFHVGRILEKTGAATRAEAVRAGLRGGLIGV